MSSHNAEEDFDHPIPEPVGYAEEKPKGWTIKEAVFDENGSLKIVNTKVLDSEEDLVTTLVDMMTKAGAECENGDCACRQKEEEDEAEAEMDRMPEEYKEQLLQHASQVTRMTMLYALFRMGKPGLLSDELCDQYSKATLAYVDALEALGNACAAAGENSK